MAFDAAAVRAVCTELNDKLTGGRIDKIHQPERDEICIIIRTYSDTFRLVISASSSQPRMHLTTAQKENPKTPPMFCMLLRKHLGSGKITGIRQIGFERITEITIQSYDELGDLTEKRLITEIMGRYSNIILVDSSGKIIDSIKHIDYTVSSVRRVLPGLMYEYPPTQNKTPLTEINENTSISMVQGGMALKKAILESISGISPLTCGEAVYSAFKTADIRCCEITDTKEIKASLMKLKDDVISGCFKPCVITEKNTGKILDFSAIPINQYGSLADVKYYSSVNEAMDEFFTSRDRRERMKQKSASLIKLLNTNIERASKKLIILNKTMSDAKNKEKYKVYGDLITANMYAIESSSKSVTVQNYYEDGCPDIRIPLDPSLSATANAQKYYKKYRKLKTAETEVSNQLSENKKELEYLESTLVSVENSETENDLNSIKAELADEGYIKRTNAKKAAKKLESKPIHLVSDDGFDIYIGKNNTQNDYLTLKFANTQDMWFHTKGVHGSHVIIKLGINKNIPESTMRLAACCAAYFSKARHSSQVAVDYTSVKNVKKPSGAKPGMVIYDCYNTVYVTPKQPKM